MSPDVLVVIGARHHGAGGGAADRLRDEGGHRFAPLVHDRVLEQHAAARGARGILAAAFAAVRVGRGDAHHIHQPRVEVRAIVLPRGGGEREQRVAVIAGGEAQDLALGRLAELHPILARQLERGLHRLRSAGEEEDLVEIAGRERSDPRGHLLHRTGGEGGAVHVGDLSRLRRERIRDLGHAVPAVRDHGAAARIDVALSRFVDEPAAFAAHDARIVAPQLAVEDGAVGIAERRNERLAVRGASLR